MENLIASLDFMLRVALISNVAETAETNFDEFKRKRLRVCGGVVAYL